uniref:RIKEN cDNA 3110082I17 gene n=1 Tax=Jaculus jaculus TaxID=51337 RepID=A0A8C5P5E4_JACJA
LLLIPREGPEAVGFLKLRCTIAPSLEAPLRSSVHGSQGFASKVPEAVSELSSEERRVLERKLKKERKKEEKKRLREAGITAAQTAKVQTPPARPSAAALALDYLRGWAQKQDSWRFQKTRQTWLLLNMYDKDKVCARLAAPWGAGSMHGGWASQVRGPYSP